MYRLTIKRSLFHLSVVAIIAFIAGFFGIIPSASAAGEIVWGKPSEVLSTDPHTSGSGNIVGPVLSCL